MWLTLQVKMWGMQADEHPLHPSWEPTLELNLNNFSRTEKDKIKCKFFLSGILCWGIYVWVSRIHAFWLPLWNFHYSWDILSTCANAFGRPWVPSKWDTLESMEILINIIQNKTMLDFTVCSASNDLNWENMIKFQENVGELSLFSRVPRKAVLYLEP